MSLIEAFFTYLFWGFATLAVIALVMLVSYWLGGLIEAWLHRDERSVEEPRSHVRCLERPYDYERDPR